jgi:hypothetical protein
LGNSAQPTGLSVLQGLLAGDAPGAVRWTAAQSLAKLGNRDGVRALIDAVRACGAQTDWDRKAKARALMEAAERMDLVVFPDGEHLDRADARLSS